MTAQVQKSYIFMWPELVSSRRSQEFMHLEISTHQKFFNESLDSCIVMHVMDRIGTSM